MPKDNNFTFWEDSWNFSKEESGECCGKWDKNGVCSCKKIKNYDRSKKN